MLYLQKKKYKEKYKDLSRDEAEDLLENNYGKYLENYERKKKKFEAATGNRYKYKTALFEDPLNSYGGLIYSYMNTRLREDEYYKGKINPYEIDSLVDKLVEIIIMAPKLEQNIVVYRALDTKNLNIIMKQMKNKIYVDKGFISTSASIDNDCSFFRLRDYVMKIYVDKGTTAIGFCDSQELELLLPPNCKFKYLGRRENILEFKLLNDAILLQNISTDELTYKDKVELIRATGYKYRNTELVDVLGDYVNKDAYKRQLSVQSQNEPTRIHFEAKIDKLNELIYLSPRTKVKLTAYMHIDDKTLEDMKSAISKGNYYQLKPLESGYLKLDDTTRETGILLKLNIKKESHVIICKDSYGKERIVLPEMSFIKSMNIVDDLVEAELEC